MPTAPSWTDALTDDWRRAATDLRHLLWFRARTVRRRRPAAAALAVLVAVTVGAAALPAAWPDRDAADAARLADLLPAYLVALVALTTATAVASGGGREVLARDPASIHPIGPLTDHLGALVLAPLSAAWLLQTWVLLGVVSYVTGPQAGSLVLRTVLALAWVAAATALGQLIGWLVEWVRRGPRGAVVVRAIVGLAVVLGVVVGVLPDVRDLALGGPAAVVADALAGRGSAPAAMAVLLAVALLVATGLLVVLGGGAAARVARRAPRDETRIESRAYPARPAARGAFSALVRTDRGSVWRSVPLRRGTFFLAIAPGGAALVHPLPWNTLVVLPGLVVSGCVLLFGVNMWCLDGRGLLWRETLPVPAWLPLTARAWVVTEVLLGAAVVTVGLGALRAGKPTGAELVAVAAAVVVATGQALSGGLRWSLSSPYAVDLRSARATPAPPLTMVGYSVRLALVTTVTTMVLAALAQIGRPDLVLVVAAVLVGWSAVRCAGVRRRWADPRARAAVVAVVAA